MAIPLRTSRNGLELIKSFEGFRARSVRLTDGRWTIGYGHVRSAREGVRISRADAEALLIYDLKRIEAEIGDWILTPLNQNEYDAVISFVFNISPGQFRNSDVLKRLNQGDHLGAANGFDAWRKARVNGSVQVVDALVRRRAAEKALFLEPPSGRASASTPTVAPELDRSWSAEPKAVAGPSQSPARPQPATQSEFEGDVQKIASAVEALADAQRETSPARSTPAAITPEQAVRNVETRISQVFEQDRKTADRPADAPAAPPNYAPLQEAPVSRTARPSESEKKPLSPEPVEATPEAAEKSPEDAVDVIKSEIACGGIRVNYVASSDAEPLADAFSLSEDLAREPNFITANETEPVRPASGRVLIDDTEILDISRPPASAIPEAPGTAVRSVQIWWGLLVAGLGVLLWGVRDFMQTAKSGEVVTQSEVATGPLLFVIGAFAALMASYFLLTRNARED